MRSATTRSPSRERDHDVASLAAGVDMSMGVDDVRQRVGSIDDGLERTRFGECGQEAQVLVRVTLTPVSTRPPRDGRSMAPII